MCLVLYEPRVRKKATDFYQYSGGIPGCFRVPTEMIIVDEC